jgi:hypothetical protein
MTNDNLRAPKRGIEGFETLYNAEERCVLSLGIWEEVTVQIYQLDTDRAIVEGLNKLRIPVRRKLHTTLPGVPRPSSGSAQTRNELINRTIAIDHEVGRDLRSRIRKDP